MSRAWMVQLLLMPLCVILQETCSSVTCSNNPGDPGNERLGNDTTALLHFQVASTTTTTLPLPDCVPQLNTGDCSAFQACSCAPNVGTTQPIGDFTATGGILQCSGIQSCRAGNANIDDFFQMNSPSTLECSAKNTCELGFNVKNVGAMCITGDNAANGGAGTFELADAPAATGRHNDVCCVRPVAANQPSCKLGKFLNVGSFFCSGDGSCDQLQVTLTGDLFCRTKDGCGGQSNPGQSDKYFRWLTAGYHCIRCESTVSGTDQGSCKTADFQFPEEGTTATVYCNGFNACQNSLVTLTGSTSCANIHCVEGTAGDRDACQGMEVDLQAGAQCFMSGNAIKTGLPKNQRNYPIAKGASGGTNNNDPVCQEGSCPGVPQTCTPSVCCTDNVVSPTSINCGPCTTSTTSTTTSTTSTTSTTTSTTSTTSTTTSTSQSGNDPSSGTTTSTTTTTTTTSGGASGDPHIHSLYGAHYTLLREGVFVAWEFKKDLESSGKPENAVHWQLLARYGGKKFRTLGILLLDNSGHKLEFSAHDCALRAKEGDHPWYIAKPGLLLPGTASSIGVQDSRMNTTSHRTLIDARISFNITGSHGSRKVASLYTHCIRGDHLNFKITMLQKKDLVSVGGEMGVHPQALEDTTHVSLLSHSASSKLRAMRTRTDEEFQAKKPWVDLGGTAASDRFFRTFNHISFVERPNDCGDEGEQEARQICAKHLPNEASNQSEVFGDCIFDVCHGGGELDAELRADLMAA